MSEVTNNVATDIAALPPAERAAIVLDSSKAETQLREMLTKTADIADVSDKDSRTLVHNAAMNLKNARVAIEKTGKTARDDANAFSKAVIAEEKRLIAIISPEEDRLLGLRNEYDRKVEEERQERERKERERVASIRQRIEGIKALPLESANDPSQQLHQTIHDLTDFAIDDGFAEFQEEAAAAKWDAIEALKKLWDAAKAREAEAARLLAERERLEAERQAEAARQQAEREQMEAQRQAEEARLQAERDKLAAERKAEEDRLQAEREKLEAERAEFEAWKAQQAAQQQAAAKPVVEEVQAEAEPAESEQRCQYCDGTGDVHTPTGEWRGICDCEAGKELAAQTPADPQPELLPEPVAEQDDSRADEDEAKQFARELAKVLAMQFNALADKVEAVGHPDFAATLRDDAAAIDSGLYDQNILSANWTDMADADKAMALASHAGVALVYGDEAMGGAVLLQAAE